MSLRFVTQRLHSYLDYPVATALVVLPFVLELGSSHPMALWLSVLNGLAACVLTMLTDHETGIWPVFSYSFHLVVDFAVGAAFILAPFAIGFSGIDAWFYWANGIAVFLVVALHKPEAVSEFA